jgi:hypothetical protein
VVMVVGVTLVAAGLSAYAISSRLGVSQTLGAEALRGAAIGAAAGSLLALAGYVAVKATTLVRRGSWRHLTALGAAAGGVSFAVISAALPHVPHPWVSRRVTLEVMRIDPSVTRPVALVKLHEDSAIFDTRGRYEWVDEHRLKHWLARNPGAVVVLPPERAEAWPGFHPLGRVKGFNYSKGQAGTWTIGEFGVQPDLPAWVVSLDLPPLQREEP